MTIDATSPAAAGRAIETFDGVSAEVAALEPATPAPVAPLSWLGEVLVTGLVHCACSHQAVHPDLLSLVTEGVPAVAPATPGHGDDAG